MLRNFLLTGALCLATTATAQAATIVIDDFNDNDQTVIQNSVGLSAVNTVSPLGKPWSDRSLQVDTLVNQAGSLTSPSMAINGGLLTMSNAAGNPAEDSIGFLTYELDPLLVPLGATNGLLRFEVTSTDFAVTVGLDFNAGAIAFSGGLPALIGAPTFVDFTLSNAELATLAGGGSLALTFNSAPGFDFAIDNVVLAFDDPVITQTPEPYSLALLGVGLVGLGLLQRRRFS